VDVFGRLFKSGFLINVGLTWPGRRLDLAEFRAQASPEAAFALLRSRVEAIGVFVLLVGIQRSTSKLFARFRMKSHLSSS